jgi:hypothetical protein
MQLMCADTNNSVSLAIDTEAPTAIVNTISEIAGTDFIININDKANGFIIKGTINGASDGDKVVVTFNSKDYTSVAFTSSDSYIHFKCQGANVRHINCI